MMRNKLLLPVAVLFCLAALDLDSRAAPRPRNAPSSLLEKALAGPLRDVQEIVFCTRLGYNDPHWYANIGYFCNNENNKAYAGNGRPGVGKLLKLNLGTGELEVLLDARGGSVRDPQVHYDGKKILFSYRKAGTDFYHLHEINVDGSGLKQLTSGEFDDYEPTYLPDGSIIFVSTRCNRWVNCWKTQVGVMYRCDGDGTNIRKVSANTEHDNTPWVLPDGRILYTRWEYVDRSQVEFHHLWTMNPDGTGQTIFYGNLRPHIVMIDAKPIPGTGDVIASFSPGHGANEHAGFATVVTGEKGPDDLSSTRAIHRGPLTRDPYALSRDSFLLARGRQILLMDSGGKWQPIYTHRGEGEVHEPRPIRPRERERIIPDRVAPERPVGHMVLSNVYAGRNLAGVERGEIRKLLILESLPKPVNFSGGQDLISWLGTFTLERVLGTVPVEEDGSAYFEVPAYRQIFFVALDGKDLAVKRMQSFTCVMPGEVLSCVGCHEQRSQAPGNGKFPALQALGRAPSRIEPFAGFPDVLDFTRDIQPILDRHCVECHSPGRREGRVLLSGDLGQHWSQSYFSLLAHRQVADGRNGLGNQPPRSIGSSASPLLEKARGGHENVRVSPREWRTLWLWIESGAPYAGTYAALRNESEQQAAAACLGPLWSRHEVLRRRCGSCHDIGGARGNQGRPIPFNYELRRRNRQVAHRPTADWERIVIENDPMARFSIYILINFTRPELSSLLLGPLAREAGGFGSCGEVFKSREDPDYRALLEGIRRGKELIDARPRFATPGFKPNRQYVREMKKYGVLPASFDLAREEIDVFQADRRYWRSFWYYP